MTSSTGAAIVGIGATEFSKDSGRSELRLAVEAALAALGDAGLDPAEVDGLVSYVSDNNDQPFLARALGSTALRFFTQTPHGGGGACATVQMAALAVSNGLADVVVCYRGMNERSQQRFGQPKQSSWDGGLATGKELNRAWSVPLGLSTAADMVALSARRYMHEHALTSEDLGRVSVLQRAYAATNPAAWFYRRPITLEDHQASKLVADPLRLLDCCQESDGAVAIVVVSSERAKRVRQAPIEIIAAAQGCGPDRVGMGSPYADLSATTETAIVADQLWSRSGMTPGDIDVAIVYDHFSVAVLMQLEALGFCAPGQAAALIREGGGGLDGSLPINTNGGQLGEAYIHGFNGIAEAVRQLRGSAVNQVPSADVALVTSGSHVPTSGLILGAQ